MRLLWLSHLLPWPPKGGVLQRAHHLLRQAAKRHPVWLVALNQQALLPTKAECDQAVAALREVCERVDVFPIPSDASRIRWLAMTGMGLLRAPPYDVN